MKDPKQIVAMMIASTVCICLIVPVIVGVFHVGEVSETFRVKTFDLILFLAGVVNGWLLASKDKPGA